MFTLRHLAVLLFCIGTARAAPTESLSDKVLLSSLKVAIDAGDVGRAQELMKEIDRRGTLTLSKLDNANPKEDEKAASALLAEIRALLSSGQIDEAKTKAAGAASKYSKTSAFRSIQRISAELSLIGTLAPEIKVDHWLSNQDRLMPLDAEVTILIFWEEWCSHCQREVPRLSKTFERFESKGLQVIGVTRVTKSSTRAKVIDFVQDQEVAYPVGQDIKGSDGKGVLSTAFRVVGIPAAGVVKDGTIVWRGHPRALTDALIEGWLQD